MIETYDLIDILFLVAGAVVGFFYIPKKLKSYNDVLQLSALGALFLIVDIYVFPSNMASTTPGSQYFIDYYTFKTNPQVSTRVMVICSYVLFVWSLTASVVLFYRHSTRTK